MIDQLRPPPTRTPKFYAEDVAEWKILHARGWSYRQLAKEWKVSVTTICHAIHGKYGANIQSRPSSDP